MPGTLNGCSFTGLQDLVNVNQLTAYPVPFSDAVTIEWSRGDLSGAELRITDQQGRLIRVTQIENAEDNQFTISNLSDLKSGCYFIQIVKGEEQVSLKVVK
jgi:hypothetical protein